MKLMGYIGLPDDEFPSEERKRILVILRDNQGVFATALHPREAFGLPSEAIERFCEERTAGLAGC